jgi:hypothetical protein
MCTGEAMVTNQYVKCVSQNHEEGSQELQLILDENGCAQVQSHTPYNSNIG